MDANGVRHRASTSSNPGSGYTTAPTVTIIDGNQAAPERRPTVDGDDRRSAGSTSPTGGAGLRLRADRDDHRHASAPPTRAPAPPRRSPCKGAVTDITVTNPGAGYLTPGLQEVRRHPARPRADGGEQPRPVHPGRGARHHHLSRAPTTTRSRSSSTGMKFHRDLPATLLRGYVQLSTSVVPGKQVAAGEREPRPGRARHADRRLHRGGRPALSRPDDRRARRTGRCGSCSATCCRPASPATCSCRSTPR